MPPARLEMALTCPEYGLGVTPPQNSRPTTVGYYSTFDYTYAISGGTGGNTILDRFQRTVANGWGTADTGQAWTVIGGVAANYSVTTGLGRVNLPTIGDGSGRFTLLPLGLTATDVDVSTQTVLTSGGAPAGGPEITGLIIRCDGTLNNLYWLRLNWNQTGTLSLEIYRFVLGVQTSIAGPFTVATSFVTGATYWLRFQALGNTISGKAWLAGTTEPTNFQLVVADTSLTSGSFVGTGTVRAATNTNVSPVLGYDNFMVNNVYTDSIRALYFAPQRFGEYWSVDRITVNDTSQGQIPTAFIMRGLVRPETAFNLAGITYPHQVPPLFATSNLVDGSVNGTNDVDDLQSPIQLSSGEYFSVLFAGAQFPGPGQTMTSTVFVGGTTNRGQ